jgi:hypothetical protein
MLNKPGEKLAAMPGCPAIEPKRKLVEVIFQDRDTTSTIFDGSVKYDGCD